MDLWCFKVMINHKTKFRRTSRACMPPELIFIPACCCNSLSGTLCRKWSCITPACCRIFPENRKLCLWNNEAWTPVLASHQPPAPTIKTRRLWSSWQTPVGGATCSCWLSEKMVWMFLREKKSNSYFKFNLFNPAVINKQWTHKNLLTLSVKVWAQFPSQSSPEEKKQTYSSCNFSPLVKLFSWPPFCVVNLHFCVS